MSTLFTNSDLSKISDAHKLKIKLADRINLGRGMLCYQTTHGRIINNNNNKFKI